MELKLRGLPVSGTKTDLIERLKPYQDSPAVNPAPVSTPATLSTTSSSTPMEVSSLSPSQQHPSVAETMTSSPPVSPMPMEATKEEPVVGMEGHGDALVGMVNGPSQVPEERDRQLHEKERQIEELLRKLEQEQRLVEALKMQLEVEKRSGVPNQSAPPPPPPPPPPPLPASLAQPEHSTPRGGPTPMFAAVPPVKTEHRAAPNCTLGAQASPRLVKLEEAHVTQVNSVAAAPPPQPQPQPPPQQPQVQPQPLPQFVISHQGMQHVLAQQQATIITAQHAGTPIVLPVSLPNNTGTIQLPTVTSVKLQVPTKHTFSTLSNTLYRRLN